MAVVTFSFSQEWQPPERAWHGPEGCGNGSCAVPEDYQLVEAGTEAAGHDASEDVTGEFLTITKESTVDLKKSALLFHKGTLCTVEAAAAKNAHLCIVLLGKQVLDKIYVLNTDT